MYGGLQNPSTMCYLNAFVQILRVMHRHKNISHSSKLCTLLTNMEFLKLSDPVPFTLTLSPLFHPESGQQDVLELMTHFFATSPITALNVALAVERRTHCAVCATSSVHFATEALLSMTPIAFSVEKLLALASAPTPAIGYKCTHCHATDATTTESFKPTGDFVLFHIKRFQTVQGHRGYRALKNIDPVAVTRDVVVGGTPFSLQAVVLHIGDMSGGHYVTDVLASRLCYDDSSIYAIPASRPALATPVLLLYQRS